MFFFVLDENKYKVQNEGGQKNPKTLDLFSEKLMRAGKKLD